MRDEHEHDEKNAREWFKDHVAELSPGQREAPAKPGGAAPPPGMARLLWHKPGTSSYHIDYLIHGRYLIVVGQMGEAMYSWGETLTFEWLAGLDVDYFHGKCVASPQGRLPRRWSEQAARSYLDERFREAEREYEEAVRERDADREKEKKQHEEDEAAAAAAGEEPWGEWDEEDFLAVWGEIEKPEVRARFTVLGGWEALGAADRWREWCETHLGEDWHGKDREEKEPVLGRNAFEWVGGIGYAIDHAVVWHLTGIKMAVAQLRERGVLPPTPARPID